MTRNPKATCQSCPFFAPFEDGKGVVPGSGQCRESAPRVTLGVQGEVVSGWPEVEPDQWCRAHPWLFNHNQGA